MSSYNLRKVIQSFARNSTLKRKRTVSDTNILIGKKETQLYRLFPEKNDESLPEWGEVLFRRKVRLPYRLFPGKNDKSLPEWEEVLIRRKVRRPYRLFPGKNDTRYKSFPEWEEVLIRRKVRQPYHLFPGKNDESLAEWEEVLIGRKVRHCYPCSVMLFPAADRELKAKWIKDLISNARKKVGL